MAAKKSTTNPTSSRHQKALDAHHEDMLRLAHEIDRSREQFNAEMSRLLTPSNVSAK